MSIIYSDESGSWNNTRSYYIRSWVKINNNQDDQRIVDFADSLNSYIGSTELNWQRFKRNYTQHGDAIKKDFMELLRIAETHFITITSPDVALDTVRSWKSYQYINNTEEALLTGNPADILIAKDKLLYTVEHVLFMLYYERLHGRNAEKILDPKNVCKWIIDEPQATQRLWKEVSTLESVNIKKSHKIPALQVADIVAGCYQDLLKNPDSEEYNFARQIYTNCLKGKVAFNASFPSPNIIYFNSDHTSTHDLRFRIENNIWKL